MIAARKGAKIVADEDMNHVLARKPFANTVRFDDDPKYDSAKVRLP
ncbi:MAG: hypothetical protein U5N55_03900 [Cypionkella sp.]|nr:hypothetical protein [Cypionkella sp.]